MVYNRLCSIFEPLVFGDRSFRLSFCLPKVQIKEVEYRHCDDLLLDLVSLKDIPMRPNAPWIRKNAKGIVFTDHVIKDSIDLKSGRLTKNKMKDRN